MGYLSEMSYAKELSRFCRFVRQHGLKRRKLLHTTELTWEVYWGLGEGRERAAEEAAVAEEREKQRKGLLFIGDMEQAHRESST